MAAWILPGSQQPLFLGPYGLELHVHQPVILDKLCLPELVCIQPFTFLVIPNVHANYHSELSMPCLIRTWMDAFVI
jgi:hypothetical protein